jgi:GrpB-like predicted nucleotidyltransferase (UPF0157 family)
MDDVVVIAEPDPGWPAAYDAARARLLDAASGRFVHLEHIGSTAVPGLAAKPVIDLLAAIASEDVVADLAVRLAPLGYDWRPRVLAEVDVAYFRRRAGGVRTHHLHVVLAAHWDGDDRRRFRDLLRARPELAAAYVELKRELAARHGPDREAYTDGKTGFITAALRAGHPGS